MFTQLVANLTDKWIILGWQLSDYGYYTGNDFYHLMNELPLNDKICNHLVAKPTVYGRVTRRNTVEENNRK